MQHSLFTEPPKLIQFVPRQYQHAAHDETFRHWDAGEHGVLVRVFTGGGKTVIGCHIAATWMARGDNYRVMIISYEKQLVWQFAQEVRDFLGIEPGIEMEKERAAKSDQVVVASRASLLLAPELTERQREQFTEHGIYDLGPLWKSRADSYLKMLSKGRATVEQIRDQIFELTQQPEAHGDKWSRLHRFDPELNWLLCFDEAHRHVRKLRSVGYLTEWFWQNQNTKQLGLTATPKRADGVSIGSEMFPAISADYPLYHHTKPCAVKDGYAVPYVQKYISVEGVDFKNLKRVAGDFDDADLERVLGEESTLAKLCQPLLDLVGDRRTLIFSPGVEMAANVARFINARSEAVCPDCQKAAWYPKLLIGDGATCECGTMIAAEHVTKSGEQAKSIHGGTRLADRKDVYEGHQSGQFQFLSVCGLCLDSESLILTDRGEVPIRNVTRDMKLWDGIEFVSHGGVIFQGTKPVIEYAGLKTTEDHNVWTHHGWQTLSACKQLGLAIRVGGIEGEAVRESAGHYRGTDSRWQTAESRAGGQVRPLWGCHREGSVRDQGRPVRLQAVLKVFRSPRLAADAVSRCKEAVRKSQRSILRRLRRSWHRVQFRFASCYGTVGDETLGDAQRVDIGPTRQQPALRSGQPSLGVSTRAGEQPTQATERLQEKPEWNEEEAEVYDILNAGPRNRFVANGLIVSNCREGYNDPDISCVAVFRPVSKAASSLAEQMKGRGGRPAREIIAELCKLASADERRKLISESSKPDCLIVDLVGITGLDDCASTALIYSEGLPDGIVERVQDILEEEGGDVEEAIERAEREDAEEKERIKQEREEAERRAKEDFERRAKANADVSYSTHDVGHSNTVDPREATDRQYKFLETLGVKIVGYSLTKKQAGRLIDKLMSGETVEQSTYETGINEEYWERNGPSKKQVGFAAWKHVDISWCQSPNDATLAISAKMNPSEFRQKMTKMLLDAKTDAALTAAGKKLAKCGKGNDAELVALGRRRRNELSQDEGF